QPRDPLRLRDHLLRDPLLLLRLRPQHAGQQRAAEADGREVGEEGAAVERGRSGRGHGVDLRRWFDVLFAPLLTLLPERDGCKNEGGAPRGETSTLGR